MLLVSTLGHLDHSWVWLFCDGLKVIWSTLEPSWDILGRSCDILGLCLEGLRVAWEHLGPIFEHPEAILELSYTGKHVKLIILILHWCYMFFCGLEAISGLCWEGSRVTWDHLGLILGHLEAILELSSECLWATWVQGHFAEMPKSLSLGPCAAKMLACNTHVQT